MTWPADLRAWVALERQMGATTGVADVPLFAALTALLVGLHVVAWVAGAGW